MIDASDFLNLKSIDDMIGQAVLDSTNKVGLDIQRNLRMSTPRDTGRASAGWEFIKAEKPFDEAIVINSVEYIVPLIFGHSKQAPTGWFDNCILAAVSFGGE